MINIDYVCQSYYFSKRCIKIVINQKEVKSLLGY